MGAEDPYRRRINNDMIDKFYITTYARKDAQITWNNLTDSWKSRTHLVVQNREKESYSQYPRVLVLPEEIQTLSPTREWLIKNSKDIRFSIFDDDLEFYKSKGYDEEGPSNTIMEIGYLQGLQVCHIMEE